jgi:hypothetical protein
MAVFSLGNLIGCANAWSGDEDFNWRAMANQAKEEQPHWITPLATVTPRLEQEFRYDQTWQAKPDSVDIANYGGGKGLEVIPSENTEVIVGVPAYMVKDSRHGSASGWGDESLTVKYRAVAANEERGNYIVTGFLGVSVPTGTNGFSADYSIYTPTIAAGKGWGSRQSGIDIQSTLGIGIPDSHRAEVGIPVTWNTAFQAHVGQIFWPEVEVNYTHWADGPNDEKTQVAITTGLVLGRFSLAPDVNLVVGAGYQQPVSAFRTFEHTWLTSARVGF